MIAQTKQTILHSIRSQTVDVHWCSRYLFSACHTHHNKCTYLHPTLAIHCNVIWQYFSDEYDTELNLSTSVGGIAPKGMLFLNTFYIRIPSLAKTRVSLIILKVAIENPDCCGQFRMWCDSRQHLLMSMLFSAYLTSPSNKKSREQMHPIIVCWHHVINQVCLSVGLFVCPSLSVCHGLSVQVSPVVSKCTSLSCAWLASCHSSGMPVWRSICLSESIYLPVCPSLSEFVCASVCVALFLLNRYWGIVTVPGSFLKAGDLG